MRVVFNGHRRLPGFPEDFFTADCDGAIGSGCYMTILKAFFAIPFSRNALGEGSSP
jgi:hypothetical protein